MNTLFDLDAIENIPLYVKQNSATNLEGEVPRACPWVLRFVLLSLLSLLWCLIFFLLEDVINSIMEKAGTLKLIIITSEHEIRKNNER